MSNIKKIQNQLTSRGLQALLLTNELDRLYASGLHTSDGAVLVFPDKAYFITDSRYIEAAREAVKDAEVLMCSNGNSTMDILKRLISENGVVKLGAQDESLSYSEYLRYAKEIGRAHV